MRKFEYSQSGTDEIYSTNYLNKGGLNGWELVQILYNYPNKYPYNFWYIFRREIKDEKV